MNDPILDWIAEGTPWLRYAVETQLLGKTADVSAAMADENIRVVINRVKSENAGIPALRSGKLKYTSTGNAFWDLFFLADIGLTADDIGIRREADTLLALQREDGTFVLQDGMRPGYFCITSILLASLAKMGYADDAHSLRFIDRIFETRRPDGGWHCAASRASGKRLQDSESCPMDNLNVLMLLGRYECFRIDARLDGAVDLLLSHWRRSSEPWRPYGFGVGSDFLKLKYPAVKYGILRVLDVLSLFPYAVASPEFLEMLAFVRQKSADGRYTAESAARSYAAFDFGQTKTPSRWITFIIRRIQKRVDNYQEENLKKHLHYP
ncbi:MAG: hypothetical protein JW811_10460 [Clostridiales bacterium]|nr:hypothetical protein [Clostridiales bacterium]